VNLVIHATGTGLPRWTSPSRWAQALIEDSYYEPQLLAASFMDYGMPRANKLPFLQTALCEVVCLGDNLTLGIALANRDDRQHQLNRLTIGRAIWPERLSRPRLLRLG
jgi:hypothetical protein